MTSKIQLANGGFCNLAEPWSSDFNIEDIAHALGNLCRYTGHTSEFYSVAEHCTLVSYLVPEQHAMAALLHDAHEAYVNDLASPVKALLPQYKELEDRVQAAMLESFGIEVPLDPCIKQADKMAMAMEVRALMKDPYGDYWKDVTKLQPSGMRVWCLNPVDARLNFLDRYYELIEWRDFHARQNQPVAHHAGGAR